MKKAKQESFFVGLNDPIGMRRSLLETSKELIEAMKKYEGFKAKREEKLKNMEELGKVIRSASRMVSRIKGSLPTMHLKAAPEIKEKPEPEEKPAAPRKPEPKDMSELAKLEAELADIEGKLNNLV